MTEEEQIAEQIEEFGEPLGHVTVDFPTSINGLYYYTTIGGWIDISLVEEVEFQGEWYRVTHIDLVDPVEKGYFKHAWA